MSKFFLVILLCVSLLLSSCTESVPENGGEENSPPASDSLPPDSSGNSGDGDGSSEELRDEIGSADGDEITPDLDGDSSVGSDGTVSNGTSDSGASGGGSSGSIGSLPGESPLPPPAVENSALAATAGMRSAVSIYCTFEGTYYTGYPWNPTPSTETYYTTGSGVIYRLEEDGSAFIVTNYHVVYDGDSNAEDGISKEIEVYLYGLENDDYAIPATYVGGSPRYDIAVLRVEKSDILADAMHSGAAIAATVGDSDSLTPGEATVVIGNPSATGLGGLSVTRGVVSVDSEYITMNAVDGSGAVSLRVIRTDAPVNGGNSGGGMYNAQGKLIGIVNAKITNTSIENIGYAIPVSVARAIADNIIDYCYEKDCKTVMRALLGVTVTTKSLSTAYDEESGRFLRTEVIAVSSVAEDGLANGQLLAGDVIVSVRFGDKSVNVTRQHHLIDVMLDVRVGDTVETSVLREGEPMTVTIHITEDCLAAY